MKKGKVHWLELSLSFEEENDAALIPSISEIFERFGEGGCVTEAGFSEKKGAELKFPYRIKTYMAADSRGKDRVRSIRDHLGRLGPPKSIPELCVRKLAEEDWAEAWKEGYTIQKPGNRVVIVPSWMKYQSAEDEVVVRMNPGRAFGSGLHPTTRLCLIGLEGLMKPGDRVLDIGTGSGILGIAAVKLGAAHVTALDIEPEAIQVAWENMDKNGLSDQMTLLQGTCDEMEASIPKSDLILANILAYTIIDLLPFIKSRLLPGGRLVSGGILDEYADDVEKAVIRHGLKPAGRLREKEWVSVLAELED